MTMADNYQDRGISFPFRIGVKGGVQMSVADGNSVQHIVESYAQILLTREGERSMEYQVYTQLDKLIFGIPDDSMQKLVEYMVKDSLNRLETRATVNDVLITKDEVNSNYLWVLVNFTYKRTGKHYNAKLGVGEDV